MERTVEPSIFGDLYAGRAGFHEVLGIEVRTGGVGRARGVYDRQVALLPQRLQRREGRMQAEEAIEIEHRFLGNIDAGSHGVVLRLAVRDDDVESIGGAALEDHDQALGTVAILCGSENRASQETRDRGGADDGEGAISEEDATSWHKTAPSF